MRRAEMALTGSGAAGTEDSPVPTTVVGRQAIYDTSGRVVAHELLFRTVGATSAQIEDAARATAEVLVTAFTEIGMNELVGGHRAFVNIPYHFLVDGLCATLPRDQVVLEILEDVPIDDRVIRAVTDLASAGYTIALDDFEYRPEAEPLLELAAIVKVDVLETTGETLAANLDRLARHECLLLAEKVEDRDDLPNLSALGFELFQGYGLDRPQLVQSAKGESNRAVMLQVMTELYRADIDLHHVVDTISHDPTLVYALLRIVNSAAMSRSSRITSLQHAVVMLGIDALRNWATMLLMTRIADGAVEALVPALVRAKLCGRVAAATDLDDSVGFTLGLLSALPELLGRSLPDLVEQLSLESSLEAALLNREGPYGALLERVAAYEERDESTLSALGAPLDLAGPYLESVAWARQICAMSAVANEPDSTAAQA